jgi:hypothetical protein
MHAGLAVVLGPGGRLAWLAQLQESLAFLGGTGGADAQEQGASSTTPSITTFDCRVQLMSAAIRYAPAHASQVAASLTVARITWRRQQLQPGSTWEAQRLALHVCGPQGRSDSSGNGSSSSFGGGKSATYDQEGFQSFAAAGQGQANIAGFHQIASEQGIVVQMPGAGHLATAKAFPELIVSNRRLSITLSRHTLLLLRGLLRELPQQEPAAEHVSTQTWAASVPADALGGESGPSRGVHHEANLPVSVLHGLKQSAYANPKGPVEHPREASVYLDGMLAYYKISWCYPMV